MSLGTCTTELTSDGRLAETVISFLIDLFARGSLAFGKYTVLAVLVGSSDSIVLPAAFGFELRKVRKKDCG